MDWEAVDRLIVETEANLKRIKELREQLRFPYSDPPEHPSQEGFTPKPDAMEMYGRYRRASLDGKVDPHATVVWLGVDSDIA